LVCRWSSSTKNGNQGKGVTVNITTREQLASAYTAALEFGDEILVRALLAG